MLPEKYGKKTKDETKDCRAVQSKAPVSEKDRQALYLQHFFSKAHVCPPAGFIEQVNGYGVQVFSQASSFASR